MKFRQLWAAGRVAQLSADCQAGMATVALRVQLGRAPAPAHRHHGQPQPGRRSRTKGAAHQRRKARREAERVAVKAAEERRIAEQAAEDERRIAEKTTEAERITEEVDKDADDDNIAQCISSDEDEETVRPSGPLGEEMEEHIFKMKEKSAEEQTEKVISEWKRSGDGRLIKTSLTRVVTDRLDKDRWARFNRYTRAGCPPCSPRQDMKLRNVVRKRAREMISSDSSPTLPSSKIQK